MQRDNRHHARHSRRLRVTLGPASSFTVDVGPGGFCAELERALPRGADVAGSMRVDGQEVAFGGQVVWVKQDDGALHPRRTIGVRFTRVPWDLQRLLGA